MTAISDPRSAECVDRLQSELGDRVQLTETDGFGNFFLDAARRNPSCVVEPDALDTVASMLRIAAETGCRVTVRRGSSSSNCAADGAVMLDWSVHLDSARRAGDRVVVDGGATMPKLLDALAPAGRVGLVVRARAACTPSKCVLVSRRPTRRSTLHTARISEDCGRCWIERIPRAFTATVRSNKRNVTGPRQIPRRLAAGRTPPGQPLVAKGD